MSKSLKGSLRGGFTVLPGQCLPVGGGTVSPGVLSGEGGRVSLVCRGGSGRGVLGAWGAHTGVVFLSVRAPSHRLAPPWEGPARPAPPRTWRCEHNPVDL